MQRNFLLSIFIVLAAQLGACVTISDGEIVQGEEARLSITYAEWWDDPKVLIPNAWTEVENSYSVLIRTDDDMAYYTETNTLPPGHLFQPWYGAYHAPENCEEPYKCNRLDAANDRTEFTAVSGRLLFKVDDAGILRAAPKPVQIGDPTFTRFGRGIEDPVGTEMHGFLRDKGPTNYDLYETQRGGTDGLSFDGNCLLSGKEGADFQCYVPQLTRHYAQLAGSAIATTRDVTWCEHEDEPRSGETVFGGRSVVVANSQVALGFVDTQAEPGHALSLWWAVFASPENCIDPEVGCTMEDINNESARPKIIDTGVGDIVKNDGQFLQTATPIFFDDLEPSPYYEYLLVVRDLGPFLDEHYYDLRFNMNTGCDVNDCVDYHYSRHEVNSAAL